MYNICHLCGTDHLSELSVTLDGFYFCSSTCMDEHKQNLQSEKRFVRGQQVMFRHNYRWIISAVSHAYFANMSKSWRYEMPNPDSESTWDIPEKNLWDASLLYDQPQQTAREIYKRAYANRRHWEQEPNKRKAHIMELAHWSRTASVTRFSGKPQLFGYEYRPNRFLTGLRKLQGAEWNVFHSLRLEKPLTAQQAQALRDIATSHPEPSLKYDRDAEWLGVLFERNLIQGEYELVDGSLKYIGLIILQDGWQWLADNLIGELDVDTADVMFEAVNQLKMIDHYQLADDWNNYSLTNGRVIYVDRDGNTTVKEQ